MIKNNEPYSPQWFSWFLLLFLASILGSCEENQFSVIDRNGNVPSVSSASVTPDSINIDNLTPVGNTYTINVVTRLTVSDPEGTDDLNSVIAQAIRPGASSQFFQQNLHDDGIGPDGVAGDSIFSAEIQFEVIRALAGRYRMQFFAVNNDGNRSNVLERTLFVIRNNSAPELDLQSLVAPDTLTLPIGGSLLIPMNIAASDSDGIADIREVYFRSLDSSNPTQKFFLQDDGGSNNLSGDAVAGDGVFSIIIKLEDNNPLVRRTFRFAFQALDSFSDTSATVLHSLTVQ
jgi:hypothetical protein